MCDVPDAVKKQRAQLRRMERDGHERGDGWCEWRESARKQMLI